MTPGKKSEGDQHGAPDEGHAARELQEGGRVVFFAAQPGEINDAGGSEGVQGAAGVGHSNGQNRGQENPGQAGWHLADEEDGQNAVGTVGGAEERRMLREGEKQNADEK